MPSRARVTACAVGSAATAVALHRLRDALPSPPTGAWIDATEWYDAAGPATATMALLRVIALAVCSWMAAASVLQVVASVRTGSSMRRIADAISPGWLREVGRGMVSLSLSAGLALPPEAAGGAIATPTVESVAPRRVDDPDPAHDAPGLAVMRSVRGPDPDAIDEDAGGVATMRPLPDSAVPGGGPGSGTTPAAPPAPTPPETYVVTPGDSCWSIAAELLRDVQGTEPDDRAIWAAWTALIDLNRPRFSTGDPDLLFPGQHLLLPQLGR